MLANKVKMSEEIYDNLVDANEKTLLKSIKTYSMMVSID